MGTMEVVLSIVGLIVTSGLLSGLGVSIFNSFKEKNHRGDTAWKQRDTQRSRADRLWEALHTHRTMCHKEHGMAFKDMPPIPRDQ